MVTVKIGEKEYTLKQNYSELSQEEVFKVAYVWSQNMDFHGMNQLQLNTARIMLFAALSDVPKHIIDTVITADQWVDILPYMNWVFKNAPDFKENPMPEIRFRLDRFIGPVGMLQHSTAAEMSNADTAFTSAANGKDPEKLFLLAAILYRPIRKDLNEFKKSDKWNGDIREPFNMTKCKARIPIFKKMPFYKTITIFLYYWSFRETKLMTFKRIFPQNQNASGTGTNRGWAGTLLEIAHLPVFGTFQQTNDEHWFTVLFEMDRQLEMQEKRESDAERSKLDEKIRKKHK